MQRTVSSEKPNNEKTRAGIFAWKILSLSQRLSSIHQTIQIYIDQSTNNAFVVRICKGMTCFLLPAKKAQQEPLLFRDKLLRQRWAIMMSFVFQRVYLEWQYTQTQHIVAASTSKYCFLHSSNCRSFLVLEPEESSPNLGKASKQLFHVEDRTFVHVRIGSLSVKNWCNIVLDLSAEKLLGTSFTNLFKWKIFPPERKDDPWHFHPAAIMTTRQPSKQRTTQEARLAFNKESSSFVKKSQICIRIAQELYLEPQTHQCVLVRTSTSGIPTVKPGFLESVR